MSNQRDKDSIPTNIRSLLSMLELNIFQNLSAGFIASSTFGVSIRSKIGKTS